MHVVNVFGGVHGSTSIGPVGIDKKPDLCPFCGLKIDACILQNSFCVDEGGEEIRVFFQCPNSGCTEVFIGYYNKYDKEKKYYHLYDVAPKEYKKREFSEYIQSTSKTFVEIYNEASHAESLELKQIVGPAYRKALEFLIKDYAISNKGEDEEKIKGMSLTNCIKTYIEDSKAIDCAKRATWIGNDETHYVKEWKDKDINDMKILMEIVINCIENEILHKQYLADMPYK